MAGFKSRYNPIQEILRWFKKVLKPKTKDLRYVIYHTGYKMFEFPYDCPQITKNKNLFVIQKIENFPIMTIFHNKNLLKF